ncbi:EMP24_GP25L domain-containing protein/Cellulose_synt domain-containing protein [Cinnamomum micranthum f. kanehirae]|uniref:EMP24_GP25L domain-containing protein/Cellulose_synt domain-containing protein n=1 Tax=Cinnamomum micranthum f. kanehirae TaxID=337451 RepID=A0A443P2D8_9MAGN|nr:EMP24_GP25L domain-containing protein/Cellulose_synt domain-containing protein [Cinnamomum micranthum f. kanehirae]
MGGEGRLPLFETKEAKGRIAYRLFSISIFVGICLIWVYRVTHVPGGGIGRWVWLGMFSAELWFGFYWILTQAVRWRPVYRYTYKERLSQRHRRPLFFFFLSHGSGASSSPIDGSGVPRSFFSDRTTSPIFFSDDRDPPADLTIFARQ